MIRIQVMESPAFLCTYGLFSFYSNAICDCRRQMTAHHAHRQRRGGMASQCDSDDDYDFIRRVNMVMNHYTELSKGSQGLLCSPIVIVILMVKLARYDYRKSCPIKCRRCLHA